MSANTERVDMEKHIAGADRRECGQASTGEWA
jgi:hypothetical protein